MLFTCCFKCVPYLREETKKSSSSELPPSAAVQQHLCTPESPAAPLRPLLTPSASLSPRRNWHVKRFQTWNTLQQEHSTQQETAAFIITRAQNIHIFNTSTACGFNLKVILNSQHLGRDILSIKCSEFNYKVRKTVFAREILHLIFNRTCRCLLHSNRT